MRKNYLWLTLNSLRQFFGVVNLERVMNST